MDTAQVVIASPKSFLGAAKKTIFTVVSKKTGEHRTFKLRSNRYGAGVAAFVKDVKEGDGEFTYCYVGTIEGGKLETNQYTRTSKPKVQDAVMTFRFLLGKTDAEINEKAEVMHHGICACCGRLLTHPESIRTGIGPVCGGRS